MGASQNIMQALAELSKFRCHWLYYPGLISLLNAQLEISKPWFFPFIKGLDSWRAYLPSPYALMHRCSFFVSLSQRFFSDVQISAAHARLLSHFLSLPHPDHYCYNQCCQSWSRVHFSPAFFLQFFSLFCILLITHVIKTKNIKPFSKGQLPSGPWTWRIKWEMTSSVVLLLCELVVHGLTATSFQFRGCDVLVLFQSHFGNLKMLNYWILINQYLFSHSKPVLGDCLVSILPCYISEYFGISEIYVLFRKINRLEGIK